MTSIRTGAAFLLAAALAACGSDVDRRVHAVETGLVEDLSAPGWAGKTIEERMAHHRVPGMSVAVIDGFEISWAKGYGTRRAGADEPVTETTLFQTASCGKPLVAATVLRLVQQRRLGLDDDVSQALRTWRLPANEFTAREPVTLRRLLSHAAGTTVHGYPGYVRGAPIPTLRQILDGLPPANSPPIRVDTLPGARYRYSNGGYLIVQQLLEDVSGKPLAALMDEQVFVPLGMKNTLAEPLPKERWSQVAIGHRSDGRPLAGGWHVFPEAGASPCWSTAADMARFGIALMRSHQGKSERLMSSALARAMLTPQPGGFGLGIGVGDDGGDRLHAMHLGANEGYRALVVFYPGRGQGAVILTNGDSGDRLAQELLRSLSREYGWVTGLTVELWMVAIAGGVVLLLGGWAVARWRARAVA